MYPSEKVEKLILKHWWRLITIRDEKSFSHGANLDSHDCTPKEKPHCFQQYGFLVTINLLSELLVHKLRVI